LTRRLFAAAMLGALACRGSAAPPNSGAAPAEEPPVALDADPAVQYPPDLYDRRVEGDVVLRLFVDSTGKILPESTRVTESSGFAALDTAAVRGVARLRYAPAYRHGLAIATPFLQTVEFRHPGGSGGPPAPHAPPAAAPTRSPASGAGAPSATRSDTSLRRDTVRARRDTTRVRRDTTVPVTRDTTKATDSTTVRPDST